MTILYELGFVPGRRGFIDENWSLGLGFGSRGCDLGFEIGDWALMLGFSYKTEKVSHLVQTRIFETFMPLSIHYLMPTHVQVKQFRCNYYTPHVS